MPRSNFWGGGQTTKDYEMMMEGTSPIAKPLSLVGHSLTGITPEVVDRVTATTVKKVRGKIVESLKTLRAARQTGITFTIQFGSEGEIFTPLLQRARKGGLCDKAIYVKRLCPPSSETAHFYTILEPSLNPPSFPNDLITIDETTNIVAQQSEGQAPDLLLAYGVGVFRLNDGDEPLYAVSFVTEDCVDCEDDVYQKIIVGGGLGGVSDPVILVRTDDRFGSTEALTTGIADGNVITSIFTDGSVVLVGFADDPGVAVAATGGTAFSADDGDSFTLDSNITEPVHDVGWFIDQYVAVGGTASGAAMFWTSDDGVTWTASGSAALPASDALTALAVDEENEVIYVVGEGGTLLKGNKTAGQVNFSAITLPGTPGTLNRVAVFGPNHVAVGGASNYYAESFDGGATWVQPSVPGTSAVLAIAGTSRIRQMVGTGGVFAERSVLTDNEFKGLVPTNGVTVAGNVTDIKTLPGEFNYFVGVTDLGETFLMRPFHPGA